MTSLINEWFDTTFCINLDVRTDRWEAVQSRIAAAGIAVERFPAIPARPVAAKEPTSTPTSWKEAVKACAKSHIAAVREARRRGSRAAFLFQDDVRFHPRFLETLRRWIMDVPADWDLLYLGGWHPRMARDEQGREHEVPRPEHVRGNVYRLRHDFCLHACGVRHTLFDEILAIDPEAGEPIDCSFIRLFQQRRRCYGLMTADESRPGAWGLVQQDHSLGSDLRDPSDLERFRWPGWSEAATDL